jgi:aspartate/tyrosine/aromatic aminotransferase
MEVPDLVEEESLFSVFDSVYQGSRRGHLEQTAGLLYVTERMLLTGPRNFPAACVAQSFPKNVGPYVGALHLVVPRVVSAEGAESRFTLMGEWHTQVRSRSGPLVLRLSLGIRNWKSSERHI